MLDKLFNGVFDTGAGTTAAASIGLADFLVCVGSALVIGLILAGFYMYRSRYTTSFIATLALLPAVVCVVIMMVNGNIGTGIAVAGAFSLVRFRSVPGTAKEIGSIFLAMGTGLVAGMGYIGYAFLCALILRFAGALFNRLDLFGRKGSLYRTMRITIPEDLDYTGVFESVFSEYTSDHKLIAVKTTNMGSLFKLTYDLTLRDAGLEKEMIDKLRCRNGNLEITVSQQETAVNTL
ncbi:MAG: DUF4956 domain-containing protein [Anaerovoracaceae bacterium]|nr:DUF4956 domain-containing protein [Bacillota bacterium]MDY2670949.1 DUF4956 domain-containing protein [Anaerovoracaceae bacterium]